MSARLKRQTRPAAGSSGTRQLAYERAHVVHLDRRDLQALLHILNLTWAHMMRLNTGHQSMPVYSTCSWQALHLLDTCACSPSNPHMIFIHILLTYFTFIVSPSSFRLHCGGFYHIYKKAGT